MIVCLNSAIEDVNLSRSTFKQVKSNVAIASAITSYARIKMIPYKTLPGTVYTDTDSVITTTKIEDNLIGKDIGQMKDELDGLKIKEIYVLGCKQYGYWYVDKNGERVEKSVWAGITRNSISFEDIKLLFSGGILKKSIKSRFYRSLQNLSITIKDITQTISYKPHKKLVNNRYIPIKLNVRKQVKVYNPKLAKLQSMIFLNKKKIRDMNNST